LTNYYIKNMMHQMGGGILFQIIASAEKFQSSFEPETAMFLCEKLRRAKR